MAVAERRLMSNGQGLALKVGLLLGTLAILLTTSAVGELVVADLVSTPHADTSLAQRLKSVWDNGDHLHYVVHLAAGRLLDACSCSAAAAAGQYHRASYHARSDWQLTLLTAQRPTSSTARLNDGLNLAARWLQWSVSDAARLARSA